MFSRTGVVVLTNYTHLCQSLEVFWLKWEHGVGKNAKKDKHNLKTR